MTKYAPLESHLRDSGREDVPMTFKEIEHVIGAQLPPSAFKHRALWSNNPTNHVMTKSWLAAGYKTADVDMATGRVVFRKATPDEPPPENSRGRPALGSDCASTDGRNSVFSHVFGALKGAVTIAPGTDLTDPIGEDWDAAR